MSDSPRKACDSTSVSPPKPDVICNLCGLSCTIGEGSPVSGPHGLVDARVSGGFESTAGNGYGALDDGEAYGFSLCEFCLDWLFGRFVKPVAVSEYMGGSVDAVLVWRPAVERVTVDDWRSRGKDAFLAEAARRDQARVKCRVYEPHTEACRTRWGARRECSCADELAREEPNLSEVLAQAILDPTFEDACSRVATWENERAVRQALRGERDPHTGALWDTCFAHAFRQLRRAWDEAHPPSDALPDYPKASLEPPIRQLEEPPIRQLEDGSWEWWDRRALAWKPETAVPGFDPCCAIGDLVEVRRDSGAREDWIGRRGRVVQNIPIVERYMCRVRTDDGAEGTLYETQLRRVSDEKGDAT